MSNERQLHMQKAVRLLQSVKKRAASDEPEAVASTAYYAMPESREAGAALHNAFETRFTGDYSAAVRLSRADAIAARDAAQSFVAYCRILQRKSPLRGKKD
jgi:uncharacterized protein (UPF0332 family)